MGDGSLWLRKVWAAGMVAIAMLYLVVGFAPVVPAIVWGDWSSHDRLDRGCDYFDILHPGGQQLVHRQQRGLALALSATGISLAAIFLPPLLERSSRWKGGAPAISCWQRLACSSACHRSFSLWPILRRRKVEALERTEKGEAGPDPFWRSGTFWLIAISYVGINMPASGMLSQMVPMMLEEGLTSAQAALWHLGFCCRAVFRQACLWLVAGSRAPATHRLFLHADSGNWLRAVVADAELLCRGSVRRSGHRCAARGGD
jgi:hypothetical protein